MKKLESIKKDTFDSFKDYQINNLAACIGGEAIKTYHGGAQNDCIDTSSHGGWWYGGMNVDYYQKAC